MSFILHYNFKYSKRLYRLPRAAGIARTGFYNITGLKGPFPLPLKPSVALKAQSSVVLVA